LSGAVGTWPLDLAGRLTGGLDQPAIGQEILYPRKALDGADLVKDHQWQDQIGAMDRAQQREGLAIMLFGKAPMWRSSLGNSASY
jgi:hypothetical protein